MAGAMIGASVTVIVAAIVPVVARRIGCLGLRLCPLWL
jgi:hypothetical protein